MKSKKFLEAVLNGLQKLWSTQISEVIDYMKTIRDDIPLFRVFETVVKNTSNEIILKLFLYYLQDRITHRYEHIPTSNWDFLDSYMTAKSSIEQILRKSLVSNMSLNPVIVEECTERDRLCLPTYRPLDQPPILNSNMPELVIYLGNTFILLKK